MIELEKLKKSEIIDRYKALQEEYENLEQEYDDLNDCYGEMECKLDELQEKCEDLKCEPIETKYDAIEQLLKELRFNTELEDRIYPIFRDYTLYVFNEMAKDYCPEIKDEKMWSIINGEINKMMIKTLEQAKNEKRIKPIEVHQKICDIIEDYIENFLRFDLE